MIAIKGKNPLMRGVWRVAATILLMSVLVISFALPAMSSDDILYTANWLKSGVNPVIPLGAGGSWDETGIGVSCVINDGGTFKMWYTGYDTNSVLQIGYATSANGTSWTKYNAGADPVLETGNDGAWDAEGVGSPSVIKVGAGDFRMWYTGYQTVGGQMIPQIGYATSANGISWNRGNGGNPVLTPGSGGAWDALGVHSCSVIYDATTFKMWYTGRSGTPILGNSGIGYATSTLGIAWTKYNTNGGPVMSAGAGGSWDDRGVAVSSVVKANSKYTMWYSGYSGFGIGGLNVAIGVAQSTDGFTTWTKSPLPVVKKEASGWNMGGVGSPFVFEASQTKLLMYYAGVNTNLAPQIGIAAVDTIALQGTATLQGGDRLAAGFDVPLTLKLYDSSVTLNTANILTATPMFTFTRAAGNITNFTYDTVADTVSFSVNVPSGSYKASLFTSHALINIKQLVIDASTGVVSMGTLKEGNADNSNQIAGADFSLLLNDYLQVTAGPKWNNGRCDFDCTGQVTSVDYSLMSMNYNQTSPQTII